MSKLETIKEDLSEDQENGAPTEKKEITNSSQENTQDDTDDEDNFISPEELEVVASSNEIATDQVVHETPSEVEEVIPPQEQGNEAPPVPSQAVDTTEQGENAESSEDEGNVESSSAIASESLAIGISSTSARNYSARMYNALLSKTVMINPTQEEFGLLQGLLRERLKECHGETLYDIGKAQEGADEDGLNEEDYNASEATLTSLANSVESDCLLLGKKTNIRGISGKYLIRKKVGPNDFLEIRIAVVGNVDAGKSTLLGVLTHGELDNGRGFARQKLFRHKHELETGRTSSIGNDILGFDNKGNVVNSPEHGSLDWVKICESSSKVITFIDLAGHERYLKTTVFGMTGHAPDFGMLMIGANSGIVGMTKEHLGLALALSVPVFVVITKIDMCPPNVLFDTIGLLIRILKSPGCRKVPVMIRTPDDVISTASNFVSARLCPIFLVSNVNGENLNLLKMFLNLLSSHTPSMENKPAEFQIDDVYSVPGVGTVVSGTTLKGVIKLNDTLLLGPDINGHFQPIVIRSIHRKRMVVPEVRSGQTASFALKKIKKSQIRKGMVMLSPSLKPQACLDFEGEILVLHHPTTISSRYQAMVHCGNIRQTAFIVQMSENFIRTGDKAVIHFRFIKHPEYIRKGQKLVFREGRTKAVGTVTKVIPVSSAVALPRDKFGKQSGKQAGKAKQGTSNSSASNLPQISGKRNRGRRGRRGRQNIPRPLGERNINVTTVNKGDLVLKIKASRIFIFEDGPAKALFLNRKHAQLVVADKNFLKIFIVDTDELLKRFNFGGDENAVVRYSRQDPDWRIIGQNILATAASGAVVMWKFKRPRKQKLLEFSFDKGQKPKYFAFNITDQSIFATAPTNGAVVSQNLNKASGMFISQEGPANALALNKEYSQVVVAGRNVFKIFFIKTDEFVENCNLRVGKNLNLNYSCNDVAWNLIDQNILATAATNGAVVLWNLSRASRSKLEHIFNEHKRTVNKVRFHAIDASLLLSGSQDGTMKCFDIRSREVAQTFYSNSESVRDVQFSLRQPHVFASVSENGNVQLWDLRKPEKHLLQFTAHSGPIFSCDWHPESEWLATASRDKTIKVWDLTHRTPAMEFLIHTIASIGHVKWRPERRFQLASSSLVVDCNINVWDVRRPYIPFASFDQHKDIPTGIVWKGNPQVFLSTGRDCRLFQHVMSDALRPASDANPQALSFNALGDVACARAVTPGSLNASKFPMLLKMESSSSQHRFFQTSSELTVFRNYDLEFTDIFTKTATRYLLGGKPFAELCDHNAGVALELGNFNVSVFWEMLKVFYSSPAGEARATNYIQLKSNLRRKEEGIIPHTAQPRNPGKTQRSACDCDAVFGITRDNYTGQEEEPETEEETPHWMNPHSWRSLTETQQELQMQGDFFFGDDEFDPLSIMDPMASHIPLEIDWTLPREAFNIRHELEECSPIPEEFTGFGLLDDLEASGSNEEDIPTTEVTVKNAPTTAPLDQNTPVLKALKHHVDSGDLQTSVTALYVLGDRRRELQLDVHTQENWVSSYAELLGRHRLFDVKTELIRRAWLPSINQLNQRSTNINIGCGECGKPLQKALVLCDRCANKECSKCSICHLPVRGLFIWCQGCAHGGHYNHMKNWFKTNKTCPEGCGHMCPRV